MGSERPAVAAQVLDAMPDTRADGKRRAGAHFFRWHFVACGRGDFYRRQGIGVRSGSLLDASQRMRQRDHSRQQQRNRNAAAQNMSTAVNSNLCSSCDARAPRLDTAHASASRVDDG